MQVSFVLKVINQKKILYKSLKHYLWKEESILFIVNQASLKIVVNFSCIS